MEKEFIPYEQALDLKELGFDGTNCMRFYNAELSLENTFLYSGNVGAPLYQQAFRWFREKHGICTWIQRLYTDDHVPYYRYSCEKSIESPPNYNRTWVTLKEHITYEEAELACLNKLIETVKNK